MKKPVPVASSTLCVFPGQGSQAPGMAAPWLASRAAREVLELAEETLKLKLGALMAPDAAAETLTQTQHAQPALLTVGLMAVAALEEASGQPLASLTAAVAGHSLGEYTAVAAAGALTKPDALRLVQARGAAMVQSPAGGMSAVLGMSADQVEQVLQAFPEVYFANDNANGQAVIAAELTALPAAEAALKAAGAKRVLRLPVGGAFHTPLQAAAAQQVQQVLAGLEVGSPSLSIYMNYTAQKHGKENEIRENLIAQITGRVRWRASMMAAAAAGVTQVIELGCGSVLAGLAPRCDPRLSAISLKGYDEVLTWLEQHARGEI